MEDSNLIACLYPADGDQKTEDAIRMRENSGRYLAPPEGTKPDYGSRESTVSVAENEEQPTNHPGLQLNFTSGPKAGQGFIIGTDRNRCDIVLPRMGSISRLHCVLTFDAERRLILRSLSHCGTIVTYDGQGGEERRTIVTYDNQGREKRHHFTWVLSGSEAPDEAEKIIIQIQKIKFQIIVSKHETYPDLYNDRVDRFLREANADDELPLGALGIQSTASTAQQSGAHTPTQTPIYINQHNLGRGNFSIVNRAWDVSTGFVYASKEFLHNMEESGWRREASVMNQVSQLSNKHIIQFVALIEKPSPRLILEYLPLGNLEDQHTRQPFSDQESLTILCQSLDALTSIHEDGIVHRDIKPENILVQSRSPLYIKFADFGLSKATADLQTFCGTHLYAAPEIYTTPRGAYYTKACDIWSLGVVIFKYVYGPLPKLSQRDVGLRWCQKIISLVDDWDSDPLLDFLSTAMLVIEPEKRLPTRKCWEQALQLSASSQSRCPTPTQASYSKPHSATPSATPTEVATFVMMEAIRDHKPQETSIASSQATVDHYLIGYDTEERKLEDQQSIANSLNEGGTGVQMARTMKRKKDPSDLAPSPRERRSNSLKPGTQNVNATDIFESHWLRGPHYVGSDVAALGEDADEESSRLSNWTSFHSENPGSASVPAVSNKQKNNQCAPEEIEESSVLEDYQHEPNVDLVAVKSKTGETDVGKHVRLEESLCAEIPSFARSNILDSKKLSQKGGGDNLDDRYYEGLDLEDEELGFYKHSASSLRTAQTLPAQQLGRSQEEDQIPRGSCDDGLDHNESGRKPVITRRKLSPTQTSTLEAAFRRNPRIDVDAQARLAEELGIERGRISKWFENRRYKDRKLASSHAV